MPRPTRCAAISRSTDFSTIRFSKKTHDWVGGEKDLRAKIIRTIGKPEERFGEDHLAFAARGSICRAIGF